jgi:hypothetical protein
MENSFLGQDKIQTKTAAWIRRQPIRIRCEVRSENRHIMRPNDSNDLPLAAQAEKRPDAFIYIGLYFTARNKFP